MNNNSDCSNLSENSFNGSHMAEISRELSDKVQNRNVDSDIECNRDKDYRYFIKLLKERNRSPISRERSCNRDQWTENSREHRRDHVRNRDLVQDSEWNCERDRSLPPYNYNAADLLNSFVGGSRRDLSMMPAYNDSISPMSTPWNNNPMNQSNMIVNQSSALPMSSNLEMAQASSSNVNPVHTPWNINPMDNMIMNQNNMTMNQSPSVVPISSNLEMAQASNSNVNSINTPWNINPIDGMIMNQNNMTMNQSPSAVPMSSNLEMTQTSNSVVYPMSTSWNINPMDGMTINQNSMSSASPMSSNSGMLQTSNSRVNPKRTRWNNPMDNIATSQSNITMNSVPMSCSLEKPEISMTEIGNNSQSSIQAVAAQENNPSMPAKEKIELRKCVLYPPNPFAPRPTRNEKPLGCKTIFVGGLPPKITEEIIIDIFEKYGAVETIKLNKNSKQNFCHMRYFDELAVEKAINLSGYRLKIDNKDEISHSTRIHVDYSQAKNDQLDYERKQRKVLRKTPDIDVKSQNNVTVSVSSGQEMKETSNLSVNACAFMTGIGNGPHMIVPQAIDFASPVKEIIQFTKSILYPPNPKVHSSTKREKPPGCRSIIVGDLPYEVSKEKLKEMLTEVFETCGTIKNVEISRYNCRIEFCDELPVENAMFFSGYRMYNGGSKMKLLGLSTKNESPCSVRLHVRYSTARDDKEYAPQRQSRHEIGRLRTSRGICYTDTEVSRICEKLKFEETFSDSAHILINWLEKGECIKKEASKFYSMIQSTQGLVKTLQDHKVKYEETFNKAKSIFKQEMDANIQKFSEIEKVFNAASVQKCWDNFTKTQRKNIEMWKKQAEEIKNAHLEEVINARDDEEMELSDDENKANEKSGGQEKSHHENYIKKLQDDIESLKSQLEAAKTETKDTQSEQEESKNKDTQLSAIRTALQNSMKEVLDLNQKYSKAVAELKELHESKCKKEGEQDEDNDLSRNGDDTGVSSSISIDSDINLEKDIRLVSLISTFLIVQPFGATVDYIWPYLHQIDSSISVKDVENLMKRFPKLFKEEESSGSDSDSETKWKFIGFQTFHTLS